MRQLDGEETRARTHVQNHDARLQWNTIEQQEAEGRRPKRELVEQLHNFRLVDVDLVQIAHRGEAELLALGVDTEYIDGFNRLIVHFRRLEAPGAEQVIGKEHVYRERLSVDEKRLPR